MSKISVPLHWLNFDLSVQDTDAVVQAFKTLARWPGVGPQRIGIVGFSAGDALACFAAADPRIRNQVAFIANFGGYFNAFTLLQDVGRRALKVNGHLQPWQPQYVPLQVLAGVIAHLLPPYEGSRLVRSFTRGGTPLTSYELASFSTDTVAAYHLLAGDEPGQVDRNLAALSPPLHALLSQLSPSRVINEIRAPIYLQHDRSDQYVPFTESRAFAAALAGIHHPYDFAEFGIFQHVEVRAGLGLDQVLGDGLNLFRILVGGLANAARLRPAAWRWFYLPGIGAIVALLAGWLGVLLVGRQLATVTALWVTVVGVTLVPWVYRFTRSAASEKRP